MPRDVDDRKKRRALRTLRRAADLAEQGLGPPLSDWEQTFLEELEERIETYGSAFADPMKGDLSEPLSALQQRKLKEIDKKARGKSKDDKPKKPGSSFKRAGPKSGTKSGAKSKTARPTKAPVKRARPIPDTPPKPARTGFTPRLIEPGDEPATSPEPPSTPDAPSPSPKPPSPNTSGKPAFRVIEGGKTD